MTHQSEITGTVIFALAVIHTFSVKWFQHLAYKFKQRSIPANFFHLLAEVEVVFGIWAGLLVIALTIIEGNVAAIGYIERADFTEPLFVFAIMAIASTRPIIDLATRFIAMKTRFIPFEPNLSFYIVTLILGPLLGSFITEPAAMTVTALILRDRYFEEKYDSKFMYFTLALLFVNVSIGGALTPYAAPPVLMVAKIWNWDLSFMLSTFGWRAALAIFVNTMLGAILFRSEIKKCKSSQDEKTIKNSPYLLQIIHVFFLVLVVMNFHHPAVFLGIFLFFLGLTAITGKYQDDVRLRESLLVAFFLAGLVVLGNLQSWWLGPLISSLSPLPLFLGATTLTSITDNAALTYLGAQIPHLGDSLKYALVAGAISGGGLTVIANAPNPAGFSILREKFGKEGINPIKLFVAALVPTFVAMLSFWVALKGWQ